VTGLLVSTVIYPSISAEKLSFPSDTLPSLVPAIVEPAMPTIESPLLVARPTKLKIEKLQIAAAMGGVWVYKRRLRLV